MTSVNQRWDELLRGVVERQRQLENALLRLGQFQHALSELMAWIDATERTLDRDLRLVAGDPQLLEVELAKLKVSLTKSWLIFFFSLIILTRANLLTQNHA